MYPYDTEIYFKQNVMVCIDMYRYYGHSGVSQSTSEN